MTTEATTMDCPMCGEEIKSIAQKCKHCGELFLKDTQKQSEANEVGEPLAIISLITPLVAAFLTFFWVGNMRLYQNPMNSLMLVVSAQVIITAILLSIESSKLGMGKKVDGKRTTGPAGWAICMFACWALVFPIYFFERTKYGKKNYCWGALVIVVVSLSIQALVASSIDKLENNFRDKMHNLQETFEHSGFNIDHNSYERNRPSIYDY